jgi:hypothetical protein
MPSSPREETTVKSRVREVVRLVVGIAVVLGLMASPAAATSVTGVDLGSIALGGFVSSFSDMMWDPIEGNHGTLDTNAYHYGANYVYVATLTPIVMGVSSFHTTFLNTNGVAGFTGLAGWSFSDALTAGASSGSGAFTLTVGDAPDPSDLLWRVAAFGVNNWSSLTPIRFFFESTYAPGVNDYYEMMNAVTGFGQGLAPDPNAPTASVPEPGTLLLLASGLLAGGVWTRRARHQTT